LRRDFAQKFSRGSVCLSSVEPARNLSIRIPSGEQAVKAGKGQLDFAYLYEVLKQGAD
jgi:hypothetical protein